LAKKKQKWDMTLWAGTSKETKANKKIWNYSSPNENLKKKNTGRKICEMCSSSGAADV
jgi:hypothetical protein